MTIVVAYADTAPGHAAVEAALATASTPGEPVVLVPAVRGEAPPTSRRWKRVGRG
jgi:hypothetical protein